MNLWFNMRIFLLDYRDLLVLILDDKELDSADYRGLTKNFYRGLIHFELFRNHAAFFVKNQCSLILDIDHHVFFIDEVHFTVLASSTLPKQIDDG